MMGDILNCIGVDYGTATTLISLRYGSRVELVQLSSSGEVVPSVIAYVPSGRIDVGERAKARRLQDPHNTLFSVKRVLGRRWFAPEVKEYASRYPFKMDHEADWTPVFETRAGRLSAEQVSAQFLRHLRETGKLVFEPSTRAVFTVPPSFEEEQRNAVTRAAAAAGFGNVELVEEPHAALFAYGKLVPTEGTAVVYDLGGGTFDMAVLQNRGAGWRLLASGGDAYLGGDDIDRRCAEWAAERILIDHRWDVRTSEAAFQGLVYACERAKIRLSFLPETSIPLEQIETSLQGRDLTLTRSIINGLTTDLVRRTFVVCDEVLARAQVRPQEATSVILAGGSTNLESVRSAVRSYFGVSGKVDVPPERVVALGAAQLMPTAGGTRLRTG